MICGYKLQQNIWKYKSVILIYGAEDGFYYKTCHNKFVYFRRKIPKEHPLYNEQVSSQSQEKNSWFW